MPQTKIKLFWNGLKVAGDRQLIKGHWSYQAAQTEPLSISERMRFYFKGYDPRSSAIAESLGGRGSYCNPDDSHGDAHFDVTPGHELWATACAAYMQQEEKRIARLEKRKEKTSYLAPAVDETVSNIRKLIARVAKRVEPIAAERKPEHEVLRLLSIHPWRAIDLDRHKSLFCNNLAARVETLRNLGFVRLDSDTEFTSYAITRLGRGLLQRLDTEVYQ